jgi:gliding motility-associated-like protein
MILICRFGYNITFYHIKIFNRWGNLVYESFDMTTGWNGRYKGINSEMGTYAYEATWQGALEGIPSGGTFRGTLTLIR